MKLKWTYLLPFLALTACDTSYKNASLSPEERDEDWVKQTELEEKTQMNMESSKTVGRRGRKGYNWWNEALHGVARAGLATV